jgi:D-psicose/D-tagatose/L-ribulose 3-epimerase
MKIAISNIAWNKDEDAIILPLFKKYGITGIEIAPTKIWNKPTRESIQSIKAYRKFWEKKGIAISSTQSVLYGHPELTIFEHKDKRQETLRYIEKMIHVSAALGAGIMVFGSPQNRARKGLPMPESIEIASDFFYHIGEVAKLHDIFFCIEPNPQEYGTDFINNTHEAIALVKQVNHPSFRLHLDTGVMSVNKEDFESSIRDGFTFLKHVHISEKNLVPLGSTNLDHKTFAVVLEKYNYDRWISIEMRSKESGNKKTVESTFKYVTSQYPL